MKTYKDFDKIYIGDSDIGSVILAGCREGEGLVSEPLRFGEDGRYTAYLIKRASNEEVEIGSHYEKRASFRSWIRIYDDEELTYKAYAETINIYRSGDFGCIIELVNPDEVNY